MTRLRWQAWIAGGKLQMDSTLRCRTRVLFQGRGTLIVGADVVLGDPEAGRPGEPIVLAPRLAHSEISIGDRTRLTNGVELVALERIALGADCLVGSDARIVDADFHGIDSKDRLGPGRVAAVEIEDNVWIGMNAIVLKGVRIGAGSVVGAGGVVRTDIPAESVAMGNPARAVIGAATSLARGASRTASG
jgi:acetyltransferase-like isoleucine patch superfamily enzyme